METPIKMDDLGGKTTIFGNTHIRILKTYSGYAAAFIFLHLWRIDQLFVDKTPPPRLSGFTFDQYLAGSQQNEIIWKSMYFYFTQKPWKIPMHFDMKSPSLKRQSAPFSGRTWDPSA